MKPTIWIFSLEPIETRYTAQWHEHIPKLLKKNVGDKFNVVQIDGVQKNSQLTPGAFLNFSDTNYWKSSQLCNFLEHHNRGETSTDDHILFTDAWNPTVIQLKYMKNLLGFNWTLHGLFHSGSYDNQDFLGRLIGNAPWVRRAESSFYHCYDHNYFATEFHERIFFDNLLHNECPSENPWYDEDWEKRSEKGKMIRTGWPMEYMDATLSPYKNMVKKDLILFPHRIAPEKQVEIFKDLAKELPEYEFVVCQEKNLTKHKYHSLLGQAKIVFSANLQETLGISCYEGAVLDAVPMIPDRLSYTEMYDDVFKYPSIWTESFDLYRTFHAKVCEHIINIIENYDQLVPAVKVQTRNLNDRYFSANNLLANIN
jgi:glycosyltransferase involved in cell wall biosynthesis